MFAILISEENLLKIQEHQMELPEDVARYYAPAYLLSKVDWYYVRGLGDIQGAGTTWGCYPEEFFAREFEYDADKIKTDWDQIVQK